MKKREIVFGIIEDGIFLARTGKSEIPENMNVEQFAIRIIAPNIFCLLAEIDSEKKDE